MGQQRGDAGKWTTVRKAVAGHNTGGLSADPEGSCTEHKDCDATDE